MNTIYGKCVNYGECKNADKKVEIGVLETKEFLCPECDNKLYVLKPVSTEIKPIVFKIAAFILGLAVLFLLYKNFAGADTKSNNSIEIIENNGKTYSENDDFYTIKKNQKVKIGIQSLSPPFNYIENGKRTGFDYDFAKMIFSQTEFGLTNNDAIDADHEVLLYEDIPGMLSKKNARGGNDVDIIMGALSFEETDTPEIIYTIPYVENFGYCLVTKKNSPIKTLADLKGKRIAVLKGDPVLLDYAKSVLPPGASIFERVVDTQKWESDCLTNDQVDAIIFDYPFAIAEVNNSNDLQVKIANLPNSSINYRIGLRKGNEKLRDELNSAIRKVKQSEKYTDLLKKYLSTEGVLAPVNSNNNPTHIVKKGETLSIIAQNHLNSVSRWREIQDLNNLPNPQFITVGNRLIMPLDYK
jgi:ABC-type amino acid transport substrate-binding protein